MDAVDIREPDFDILASSHNYVFLVIYLYIYSVSQKKAALRSQKLVAHVQNLIF